MRSLDTSDRKVEIHYLLNKGLGQMLLDTDVIGIDAIPDCLTG